MTNTSEVLSKFATEINLSAIDFNTLPYEQLLAIHTDVTRILRERADEEHERFRTDVQDRAKRLGIDLASLVAPQRKPRASKGTLPAKYRNPDNPEQTWTGKGKAPRWLQEKIDAGNDRADYAIA